MYPINRRFCELCLALEIVTQDECTEDFYDALRRRVSELVDSSWELVDGELRVERLRNQGPTWSLNKELDGTNKTGMLKPDTASPAVYRLLGFVRSSTGWVQLPRDLSLEQATDVGARHRRSFGIVPQRVRLRILEIWESAPHLLRNYAEDAIAYLMKERADPLPQAPWNLPYEFENGHEFIFDFLQDARAALTEVTVAAVSSYMTASIGRHIFLGLLARGVRVRFLLFDFVQGDTEHVARMIRRSPDALRVAANDTVEALLWLREKAGAASKLEYLEVRLFDRDLEGRWYLIDPSSGGRGFVVSRASAAQEGAAAPIGVGRISDAQELTRHLEQVNLLWSRARELNDWLPNYEAWKSDPNNQVILGLR